MRSLLLPVRLVAVGGPIALAYFSGGYIDEARQIALMVAAVVLAVTALIAPAPLGRGWLPRVALAAIAALAGWIALSGGWTPMIGDARRDLQRVCLYAVALAVAAAAWRPRDAARAAEALVATGIVGVVVSGLAGRLVPDLVPQAQSMAAAGRLEQPLTYWNAMGAMGALGVVLCLRIAGDWTRRPPAQALAAMGVVPSALGVYLSFSRGALAALAGGLLVLAVSAPSRTQLRAGLIALLTGGAGVVLASKNDAVRALWGDPATLESEGHALLLKLAGLLVAAALLTIVFAYVEARRGRAPRRWRLPRFTPWVAAVIVVGFVTVPILAGGSDVQRGSGGANTGATTQRLTTLGSNRPEYWRIALDAFRDHAVKGIGSSGYPVEWLRHRPITENVHDAHSIEIETLAELGLVGFALLVLFSGTIAIAARRVAIRDPVLAAGPVAALVVYALHASIDWDWEMPALTLPVITLAGVLLGRADEPEEASGAV